MTTARQFPRPTSYGQPAVTPNTVQSSALQRQRSGRVREDVEHRHVREQDRAAVDIELESNNEMLKVTQAVILLSVSI
jgi:hypothetical protein